ncbi:MAG: hypothetical protein DRI01_02930 [Chloroflexi bacterium]|nr:MAG: hypothetical protein DRI01_02930 [Chloroflexota bacterium]
MPARNGAYDQAEERETGNMEILFHPARTSLPELLAIDTFPIFLRLLLYAIIFYIETATTNRAYRPMKQT